MLSCKLGRWTPALVLAMGVALSGCEASKDGQDPFPAEPPETGVAKFNINLAASVLDVPHPYDGFFLTGALIGEPVDGTLALPPLAFRSPAMQAALNSQDGWSTTASLTTGFSLPLDPASINASSVKIIKLWVDPGTKAPASNPAYLPTGATSPVAGVLTYGTDFTADVSPDFDSHGTFLRITPLKPLAFSTGPTVNDSGPNIGKVLNVGYLVVLTDGLRSTNGSAMGASDLYASFKSAPADCSTITDATLNGLCRITKGHLLVAQGATGTSPSNVILTWHFSTQSIDDVLDVVEKIAVPTQTLIVPTGLTTKNVSASLAGKADVYVGSTVFPYYLTPAANPRDSASVLTKFWTAAGPSPVPGIAPSSRNLTMFNPTPAKVADVTVPILVTIPNATSACPGKPTAGWPVAIVQHGITRNRSDALAIADAFADACFVVVSKDLPLHGITDTTSPLYCNPTKPQCIGATERTFDVDLVNNTTGASTPDGVIDSSGAHFINLLFPATGRDNLRQGEADLITFTKSVRNLAIAPGTPAPAGPIGVDPTRISYVGQSLGGIVGGSHVHFVPDTRTASLNVPGGVLTKLLIDSPTFGPRINAALGAQLAPNSFLYNLFLRDFQAVVDSADPINHIKDAVATVPVHIVKVLNDAVVPNSATDRLIAAGPFAKLKTIGPNAVGAGSGGYTFFSKGDHGSLFSPAASLPATVEMQRQTVGFAASAVAPGGPFVVITDPTVLDLN
jgi:hypothetical protein